MNYAIIGVEGNSDQAFVSKVLKLLGFKDFKEQHKGLKSKLDPFWYSFIPKYPKKDEGNLYQRLDMPSILFNDNISVAIYAGEGSNLITNLDDIIYANSDYQNNISAFGIVADCDRDTPANIVKKYADSFQSHFPNFPQQCGIVDLNIPRTGIYILPDNKNQGVLESLLIECGNIVYPELIESATNYINIIPDEYKRKWKPFDEEKALIATIVSILKPGKTNTVSIADNKWISEETQKEVINLHNFVRFMNSLLLL